MRKLLSTVAAIGLGVLFSLPAFAQTAVTNFGGNLLINPWMEIDQLQEGTAISVTANAAGTFTFGGGGSVAAFTLGTTDGWATTPATSASGITMQLQNAAIAPNGSASDLLYTVGTGSATHADGTLLTIEQRIEPMRIAPLQYGTANAQGSYLSFCAKASIAGNYSFYISGGTNVRTSDVATENNAATTGSTYFHVFNIPTASQFSCYQFFIPGDTGGTWLATTNTVDQTHGAVLGFVLGLNGVTTAKYGVPTATAADGVWLNLSAAGQGVIGSNASQVAMDKTSGSTFELTGVKWSLDANPLTHNPELELIQAQRYRAKTGKAGVGGISGLKPRQSAGVVGAFQEITPTVAAYALTHFWQFPTIMRAVPTITTFNPSAANANWRDITGAADFAVVVDTGSGIGVNGVNIGTGSISATVAHACAIIAFADANL